MSKGDIIKENISKGGKMKSLLSSKKSIIAICILFFTILIIAISMCCLTTNEPRQANIQATTSANQEISASNSESSTLAYIEGANAHVDTLHIGALTHMRIIIRTRGSKNKQAVILSETEDSFSYFMIPNLNQTYYNNLLYQNSYVSNEITGTCTLIAIVMAKNIIDMNDNIKVNYADNGNKELRNLLMLKDLYEISTNLYHNDYSTSNNNIGTQRNTICEIIKSYFDKYGINLEVTDEYYSSNVRDNIYKNYEVPTVLSINKFYSGGNKYDCGHSVVVQGAYVYKVEYRTYSSKYDLVGLKHNKYFYIYVISDGWHNASDDKFGEHLQLLVFEDEADFAHDNSIKGWMNYGN